MKSTFEAANPDEIQFTLTLTMSLKSWRELRERISKEWPGSEMRGLITDMAYQAEKTFYPTFPLTPENQ